MSGPAALFDSADVSPVPWRNGAGLTRDLHTGRGWELSLADLVAPCPFSTFAGSDRVHLPLEGGYTLLVDGVERVALKHRPIAFAGGVPVLLRELQRPTTALNLIFRRGSCVGSLVVTRRDGRVSWPSSVRAVVLLGGVTPVVVTAGITSLTLDLDDAVVAEVHIHESLSDKEYHP